MKSDGASLRAAIARLTAPGTEKFVAAKALMALSESHPARLLPHFDALAALLDTPNRIIVWNIQRILATLAVAEAAGPPRRAGGARSGSASGKGGRACAAAKRGGAGVGKGGSACAARGRIDGVLDRYLAPIAGPVMITAANAIAGAGRIASARPDLQPRIVAAILGVEKARYATAECRNVAIGHALETLRTLALASDASAPSPEFRAVLAFARRQLKNPRPATAKKAGRLVRQVTK
jgi:hypothetical protein